ncbi:hypothetical protein GCM10011611_57600 [Aliidongia dinghuensis]|uniref:Phasin family protein n=1 Tax=Aliidongia dinghuensis TaxID=1867774 RepID=A0A8J3E527_9PROT|nr:hypothetical protein [Aliidongia dinghuensis]GGF43700.1 hypothetical protein GCM10011611_57600 [Aliidongia dinghuensis]
MAKTEPAANGILPAAIDPIQLLDAGHRSANLINAGTGLMAKTMGDIVARQADFIRVEGDEIAKCAVALARGSEPVQTLYNLAAALQSGAEDALTDFRQIQDLMRGCAWGLFGLYIESIGVAAGLGRLPESQAA